jgi:1-acyl-sn-glycerol-3-phosphate acyltransferase
VKRTIRLMRDEKRSLLLFAEARLHRPPELLPFGKALETIAEKVPDVSIVPVAIHYEMAFHERPEAYVAFGDPVPLGPDLCERTREAVQATLEDLKEKVKKEGRFEVLVKGTDDVNERWDMRGIRNRKS